MRVFTYIAFIGVWFFLISCGKETAAPTSESKGQPQKPQLEDAPRDPEGREPKPGSPQREKPRGRPASCSDVLDKFMKPANFTTSTADIKSRFSLDLDLRSASKSGAFPSLVIEKADGKRKFLKIFPAIKAGSNKQQLLSDQSFLEIFHTCRLANLYSHVNLPPDIKASKFFVDFYGMGFLKTADPFEPAPEQADSYFPYLISEAVDNVTLTDLAKKPDKVSKPDSLGFNLRSAPKMVLESILLQIIVALKNADSAFKLFHYDLHTGNILLSKNENADFNIISGKKQMKLAGPLIKIIDFGLGEARGFKQPGASFEWFIKARPFIAELEEFIQAVTNGAGISGLSRLKMYRASSNQDIYMFNLMLAALTPILDARGSKVSEYCRDYDDCIRMMSQWWK